MLEQHRTLNTFSKDFSSYGRGRRELIHQQKKAKVLPLGHVLPLFAAHNSLNKSCVFCLVVSFQEEDIDENIQLCILSETPKKNLLENHTLDAKESETEFLSHLLVDDNNRNGDREGDMRTILTLKPRGLLSHL